MLLRPAAPAIFSCCAFLKKNIYLFLYNAQQDILKKKIFIYFIYKPLSRVAFFFFSACSHAPHAPDPKEGQQPCQDFFLGGVRTRGISFDHHNFYLILFSNDKIYLFEQSKLIFKESII